MFAPFSRFLPRRPAADEINHLFVEDVRTAHPREPRSRRSERVLLLGWVLIAAKSAGTWWICHAYPEVPVNPWWIIAPTLLFASLCTLVYYFRD